MRALKNPTGISGAKSCSPLGLNDYGLCHYNPSSVIDGGLPQEGYDYFKGHSDLSHFPKGLTSPTEDCPQRALWEMRTDVLS